MRKQYYAFLLVIFCFQLNKLSAQEELKGFLGIPFATTMKTAKKLMLQKPGVNFVRKDNAPTPFLYFTGLAFGGFETDTCYLMFDGLHHTFLDGGVSFKNPTIDMYHDIYHLIFEKYGSPSKIEGDEESFVTTYWNFPVKGEDMKDVISLTFNSGTEYPCYIRLSYDGFGTVDREVVEPYVQRQMQQRKKQLKDF